MKVHVRVLLALILNMNLMASDIDDGDKALKNQDPVKAMQLYQRACDVGNEIGCKKAKLAYSEFVNQTADYADGLHKMNINSKALKIKCDAGEIDACYELGALYANPLYIKIDGFETAAVQYYEKACVKNHSNACNDAGVLNYRSSKNSKTAALQYFEAACKLKNQTGCENLEILTKEIKQKWREILENQKLNIVCQDGKGGKYEYPKQTGIMLIKTNKFENLEFFFENSCEVVKK